MKSREEELAGKLKRYLDQGAAELRPGLAYRLQQARAQALARLSEDRETASAGGGLVGAHGLLGAGAGGGSVPAGQPGRVSRAQWRLWLGVAVLALAAYGWQQWAAWREEIAELEDIDTQILASELPVDALADQGFQLFLETAPPPMPEPVDPDAEPVDAAPAGGSEPGSAPAGSAPPRSEAPHAASRVA